ERRPRRHDEGVARLELVAFRTDRYAAATLGDRVDGAVGAAIRLRAEAIRQELDERRDRRHGMAAGERVDEPHLPAVAGVGILIARQKIERFAAARIGVVEYGRRLPKWSHRAQRREAIAEPRGGRAFAARHGLDLF